MPFSLWFPPGTELYVRNDFDTYRGHRSTRSGHYRSKQWSDRAGVRLCPALDLSEHVKPYIDRLIALRQGDSRLANSENSAEGQSKSKKIRKKRKIRRRNPEGPLPELDSLAPQEKAHWIFMERSASIAKTASVSKKKTN